MDEFLSPDDVAELLSVTAKTVRDWLRSGDLIGIKVGKSWRIHRTDLDRLIGEQLFKARLERASRVEPSHTWVRGQCCECGILMPEPNSSSHHWVCSPKCKRTYDEKTAAVLGWGTEEFVRSCGTVVPQY